jgi:TRAP transporter TAXI family solute receptor
MFSSLAPGVVQYAVLEESGIKTVKDLAGKRVAIGPQGNSSGPLFMNVLEFYGMTASDVTRSYVSFADGVSELLDGHVDMAIVQAGVPAPGLQEAFAGPKAIRIISFPEKERDEFLEKYLYYIPYTIPKESYTRLPEIVITFATQNIVLVHAALSKDTVYAITKAVFEHLPDIYAAHPTMRSVTLNGAAKTPIPLHEGSVRFFKEASAKTDGN